MNEELIIQLDTVNEFLEHRTKEDDYFKSIYEEFKQLSQKENPSREDYNRMDYLESDLWLTLDNQKSKTEIEEGYINRFQNLTSEIIIRTEQAIAPPPQ